MGNAKGTAIINAVKALRMQRDEARKVLPARDIDGAIRYLDHGNIPLPREVAEYHRQKIEQRAKADGIKADIEMVINDVTYLSRTVA